LALAMNTKTAARGAIWTGININWSRRTGRLQSATI
jgi:hypothetical protein